MNIDWGIPQNIFKIERIPLFMLIDPILNLK